MFLLLVPKFRTSNERTMHRSSRPEVFCKKGALKNMAKFTGKRHCRSLFFNRVAGLKQVFSCEFCEVFKDTFFIEHFWWLLLYVLFQASYVPLMAIGVVLESFLLTLNSYLTHHQKKSLADALQKKYS